MSTNHHKREDPLVEMGYEIRDIDLPKLKKSVVYFFAFVAFSAVTGWIVLATGIHINIFGWKAVDIAALDPGYSAGKSGYQNPPKQPPAPYPLLQTNATAKTDLMLMRQKDEGHLESTGYANEARTKTFIPIDRAIDLLVERGIDKPVPTEAKSKGTVDDKMNVSTTESPAAAMQRMNEREAAAVEKYGAVNGSAPASPGGNQ
jgi:hypothetical protein